ncbi:hypothetical protein FOZ63_001114, partial [Perkinsus olseni]
IYGVKAIRCTTVVRFPKVMKNRARAYYKNGAQFKKAIVTCEETIPNSVKMLSSSSTPHLNPAIHRNKLSMQYDYIPYRFGQDRKNDWKPRHRHAWREPIPLLLRGDHGHPTITKREEMALRMDTTLPHQDVMNTKKAMLDGGDTETVVPENRSGGDTTTKDLLGFEPFSEPPTDDELLAMARGEVGAWPHNLYVNPAVGVKMAEEFGGGRGLYNISDHVIPTGSLIAFERPLLIEPSYDQLLSSLQSAVADSKNKAIIEKLFSGSTEGAADLDLEGILSHNYMAEEPLPVNGKRNVTDDKLFNRVGLWPFLSMANHYYLPNVTRSHIGKEGYLASRAIKDIPPGGQVLDNYCPTLMPWVERNKVTHSQHGFNEPFDSKYDMSPPEELTALMQAVREIKQALVAGQPTAEQYALAGEEGDSDGSIEPPTVKEHSEMCFQSLIGTLEEVDGSLKDPSLAQTVLKPTS